LHSIAVINAITYKLKVGWETSESKATDFPYYPQRPYGNPEVIPGEFPRDPKRAPRPGPREP